MGYAAADRHFSQARMNPELLMIESDHDLRNPADFLVIDKIAKAIFRVPGIARVQAITRPEGNADRAHLDPVPDQHAGRHPADEPEVPSRTGWPTCSSRPTRCRRPSTRMTQMYGITAADGRRPRTRMVGKMKDMTVDIAELRDNIADFDDFFRPIRNYFYWEPHCYDIPVCWSLRSIFDTLDGIDTMTDDIQSLLPDHGTPRHADAADGRADARR